AIRNLHASAWRRREIPDIVEIKICLGRSAVSHLTRRVLLTWRVLLGSKPHTSPLLDALGQFPHGLPSNRAAFTTGYGSVRLIDRRQDFLSSPLTLFPQRKCLLHRIFLARKPPAFNRIAGKGFLIRSELHFHTFSA